MSPELTLVRHFLGAIAYRAQKALRDAPGAYAEFSAGNQLRTPVEILRHMTSLLGYVRTFYIGGSYPMKPDPLADFDAEIARFHDLLEDVGRLLESGERPGTLTYAQLLQGPLADLMTHVGQLALLRRLSGSPVPPENFIHADVSADRLGRSQPLPARPDDHWPEAPTPLK
jgi:hypothetical protein